MDDFQSITNKLQELSKFDNSARTKISRLKQLLPEIENAIKSGVTRLKILEVLNEYGLNLTVQSYGVMMNRLKNQDKNLKENLLEKKSLDTKSEKESLKDNSEVEQIQTLDFPLKSSKNYRNKERIEDENSDN